MLVVLASLSIGPATAGLADAPDAKPPAPSPRLSHVLLQTSLYTHHFSRDPEHTNNQQLMGLELHDTRRRLIGAARFKNSFNQASLYLYIGRELPLWSNNNADMTIRGKLTAGVLHGYRGEYRDKIPFNRFGIAPAILPSIGVRKDRFESDLIVFGTAGIMVTVGLRL